MTELSLVEFNASNGSYHFSGYAKSLFEPQIMTGAILISTGDCLFADDLVNMSVSLQADLNDSVKDIGEY